MSEAVRIAGTAHARGDACAPRCASCRYRAEDRHSLEQSIPGLTVFSSGFGASVADSRLCRLHDQFVSPDDACAQFEPIAHF
ncbi:hypothetical protein [Paraburkholderia fungorum]|jgi:hypothetical protein|uniref:Uncharacterized protein n=1 Tax=Paraburkholderia fungorum TaxID=134537 RepID=A0AAW3V1K0_9BURK|nr:hypothetical protein [Paraburkholderia fungorum]MBB4515812.1 hypothetical protein [Paraburkholderia fungorum]MBB6203772.1 hypothetical protein [Paraburkholderia fungorum]PZR40036.1 MAG: hypothetical protein DI523_35620 [Paraburkholderia fungorum]QLD48839.1 hypothetical protein C9419_07245 [Paraburkholderia fungorum]